MFFWASDKDTKLYVKSGAYKTSPRTKSKFLSLNVETTLIVPYPLNRITESSPTWIVQFYGTNDEKMTLGLPYNTYNQNPAFIFLSGDLFLMTIQQKKTWHRSFALTLSSSNKNELARSFQIFSRWLKLRLVLMSFCFGVADNINMTAAAFSYPPWNLSRQFFAMWPVIPHL